MSMNSYIPIFQQIKSKSGKLRQKLTEYGYSQPEINAKLVSIVISNDRYKNNQQDQGIQNRDNSVLQNQGVSFQHVILESMNRNKNNVEDFLIRILGSLQIIVIEIEEYQKLFTQLSTNNCQQKSQICLQAHQQSRTAIMPFSIHSISEQQKKSNISSTQVQSFTGQQVQLQSSLKNLLYKTKILRSILQRKMETASILNISQLMSRRSYGEPLSGGFVF